MSGISFLSQAAVPILLAVIGAAMLLSKKDLTTPFLTGAKEGMQTAVRLLPTLVLLLVGTSMLTASGAAEGLASMLAPILIPLGIPEELIGFLMTRPFSGSASTAMAAELLERLDPDSTTGVALSLILATSDTAIYVISVYMTAAGIKHTRHTIPAVVLAMVFGIFFCCMVARLW